MVADIYNQLDLIIFARARVRELFHLRNTWQVEDSFYTQISLVEYRSGSIHIAKLVGYLDIYTTFLYIET